MTFFDTLRKAGEIKTYPKGHHVFRYGDTEAGFYLILKGLTKAYYVTHDGKEFIKSFISEGQNIACMQYLVEGLACNFSLVTLEDSEILVIDKKTFFTTLDHTEYLPDINNLLIELALKKERREHDFLCLSATERYNNFQAEHAGLIPRLKQSDIAQYLGITPVALSRIKSAQLVTKQRPENETNSSHNVKHPEN